MPTERCGKIGYLLRHRKAHVVSRVPFVVQLDYDSTTYTQDVSLGIDAGSKRIGVSASSEKKEMLAAQVELRSDIVKLLSFTLISLSFLKNIVAREIIAASEVMIIIDIIDISFERILRREKNPN